jgi:hypothetical protein
LRNCLTFCPASIGGCRGQPGVHRLPDELIFVADDNDLAGFFAMIKSSPSNLGNAVEDTGDYRLFRLFGEKSAGRHFETFATISDKGRHHRCKQLESKKAAK